MTNADSDICSWRRAGRLCASRSQGHQRQRESSASNKTAANKQAAGHAGVFAAKALEPNRYEPRRHPSRLSERTTAMELRGGRHVGFAVRLSASGIFGVSDRASKQAIGRSGWRSPMAASFPIRALLVRMASAVGLIALSLFFVGLIPFLSAGPSVGASFPAKAPPTSANGKFRGARLPLPSGGNSAFSKN